MLECNRVLRKASKTLAMADTVSFSGAQSSSGWQKFAAGWTVGGLAGVAWCYILTQTLPYYF